MSTLVEIGISCCRMSTPINWILWCYDSNVIHDQLATVFVENVGGGIQSIYLDELHLPRYQWLDGLCFNLKTDRHSLMFCNGQ